MKLVSTNMLTPDQVNEYTNNTNGTCSGTGQYKFLCTESIAPIAAAGGEPSKTKTKKRGSKK